MSTRVVAATMVLAAAITGPIKPLWAGTHEQVFEYIIKGNQYLEDKETRKAIREFTRAVEFVKRINEEKEFPIVYYNRARAYEACGDLVAAIQDYSTAISLGSNYTMAYYNRGLVYQKTNQLDLALQDYTRMIEQDPKQLHAYNNRGLVYTLKGEYTKALDDFGKAIRLDDKAVNVHLNRGLTYLAMGDYAAAHADFSLEQEKHPRSLGAPLLYRMVTAFMDRKYAECRLLADKLAKMNHVLDQRFLEELDAAVKKNSSPKTSQHAESKEDACPKIETDFQRDIETANYCETDDDCMILDLGCPFGCGTYIHKKEEEALSSFAARYRELGCPQCEYKCMGPVQPVCEHRKCVPKKCEVNLEYGPWECECPDNTITVNEYRDERNIYLCVPEGTR